MGFFNSIWKILKQNLIGLDKVMFVDFESFKKYFIQDWKCTKIDGTILDYLGKLVRDRKIDPVKSLFLQKYVFKR